MDGSSSNKKRVEARLDREDRPDWLDVSILMETFDCGICQEPLSTVIFECWLGHFTCLSCYEKIPGKKGKKCPLCSVKTCLRRSFGMENVIQSITVPCSNAKYGCREGLAYYRKEQHEQECLYAPCFCPESDCTFAGPTPALLDHLTTQHKFPSTVLPDSGEVSLRLQPGLNVLPPRNRRTGYFFVISMSSRFFSFGYAITFICVQPNLTLPTFTCRYKYDCPVTGYSESSRCQATSSSFSDGLSKGYNFVLPKHSDDQNVIMLRTTIRKPSGKEPTLSDCSDDDDDDIPSRFDRALQRKSLFDD